MSFLFGYWSEEVKMLEQLGWLGEPGVQTADTETFTNFSSIMDLGHCWEHPVVTFSHREV